MILVPEGLTAVEAEWRESWCIYPVYLGVAERFALDIPACAALESPVAIDSVRLDAMREWQKRADDAIQVHQLRVFLQSSKLSTEEILGELVRHHLRKRELFLDADRDKLDFLLVQYFSHCVPVELVKQPAFADVARILGPVLGEDVTEMPHWANLLDAALCHVNRCDTMRELLRCRALREVREIKISAGHEYWTPPALVAFAWGNYILRQSFFRLMKADVEAVQQGVRELARRSLSTLDCARAQLSREESLAHVVNLCRQWRKPFQAEYSAGNPFAQLAELRAAVEETLAKTEMREHLPEPVDAGSDPRLESELTRLLARLPDRLRTNSRSRELGATIVCEGARMVLSPDEVEVLLDESLDSRLVRRALACRLLLFQTLEHVKNGVPQDRLVSAIAFAQKQAQALRGSLEQYEGERLPTPSTAAERLEEMIRASEQEA